MFFVEVSEETGHRVGVRLLSMGGPLSADMRYGRSDASGVHHGRIPLGLKVSPRAGNRHLVQLFVGRR